MRKSQFSIDLSKVIEKNNGKVETIVKKVALEIFNGIVLKTPVDTGHLAYNWQMAMSNPITSEIEGVDPTKQSVLGKGKSEIAKWTQSVKNIYITNNVPYAMKIEYYGSKVKAPQGMVRVTLREVNAFLSKAMGEVK